MVADACKANRDFISLGLSRRSLIRSGLFA
jgi:hypothetical protein